MRKDMVAPEKKVTIKDEKTDLTMVNPKVCVPNSVIQRSGMASLKSKRKSEQLAN